MIHIKFEIIVIVIFLLFFVIVHCYTFIKRSKIQKSLKDLLQKNKFDEFDDLCNKKMIQRLFPLFSLWMMKLNYLIDSEDLSQADVMFTKIDQLKLNTTQAEEYYSKGFYYYLKRRNQQRCLYYLNNFKKVGGNQNENEKMKELYQIVIEKNISLLDKVLSRLEGKEPIECYQDEYLICKIYENMGDTIRAEEYRDKAILHKKQFDIAIERFQFDKKRNSNKMNY